MGDQLNLTNIIELITPKQSVADLDGALQRFERRYREIIDHGFIVSIPDNPMGTLRFRSVEMIEELRLPISPEKVLIHINTFHTKEDLDRTLKNALALGVKNLLVVSGDGGERLARLSPEDLGCQCNTVTAVELLTYILSTYPAAFKCGVAFNPYEPPEHENAKLKRKLEAGASFVATQPVIAKHDRMDDLAALNVKVFVGAWMSQNLKALSECVGYTIPERQGYEPLENVAALRMNYPVMGIYFCAVHPNIRIDDLLA